MITVQDKLAHLISERFDNNVAAFARAINKRRRCCQKLSIFVVGDWLDGRGWLHYNTVRDIEHMLCLPDGYFYEIREVNITPGSPPDKP